MTSYELREKFIKFFENKDHKLIPSASLIPPENNTTALFISAGMHPLVPFLLGEKHLLGKKLVGIQKCLRVDDIDEVGDAQHNTFFEMLGYWSLGDYFKKQSIHYTFDFFTEVLVFKKEDISVTVFAGDGDAPFDQESYDTWKNEIGIPEERIFRYGKKENWWGPVGESGPCGPCTEMFIDTGAIACGKDCSPSCNCDKFVEIGNNVFMEYKKTDDGKFEQLTQKNVDVGLGFERLSMFAQDKKSVFEIDLFKPIIKKIEDISGKKYEENQKEFRIIADHIRAATFAINDGVIPSNKERGYVVRRLIRRAIVKARQLGISENFTTRVAESIFDIFEEIYKFDKGVVNQKLEKEETKFRNTFNQGLKNLSSKKELTGEDLFNLYQSFGIPMEIAVEEAKRRDIIILEDAKQDFLSRLKKHQDLSRTASAGMFKGGLASGGEKETKYHTATHLLLASLRQILGSDVAQKGSNITAERLRFDFNWSEKLTDGQIKKVQNLVNEKIKENLPVDMEEMSLEDAKNCGATGVFENKYGEKVKVYNIGPSTVRQAHGGELSRTTGSGHAFSMEICGGPHVKSTGELGHFKIIEEESSSAGVRRIKAILE